MKFRYTPSVESMKHVPHPRLTADLERLKAIAEAQKDKIKILNALLNDVKLKNRSMRKAAKVYPEDRWYIAYLQSSLFMLESQYSELQGNYHKLSADLTKEKERNARIATHQ